MTKKADSKNVKVKSNENKSNILLTVLVWVIYVIWLLKLSSTALTLTNFLSHLFFLALLIFINFNSLKVDFKNFKNSKKKFWKLLLYLVILIVMLFITNIIISYLTQYEPDSTSSAIYTLFKKVPFGTMFVFFLTVCFYPIVEELIFRKSLRGIIRSDLLFVVISSLLAWYFQVTLINPTTYEFIISIGTLFNSLFAAIVYIKNKSILYAIFPRMLYNIIICTIQIFSII